MVETLRTFLNNLNSDASKLIILFIFAIVVSSSLLLTIRRLVVYNKSSIFKNSGIRNFVLLFLIIITIFTQTFAVKLDRETHVILSICYLIFPPILTMYIVHLVGFYANGFFSSHFETNEKFNKSFKRLFLSIDLMILLFSFVYIVRQQQLIDIAIFKDEKLFQVFYFIIKVFALNRIAFFTNDLFRTLSSALIYKNVTFSKIFKSISIFIFILFWALFCYLVVSSFPLKSNVINILNITWKLIIIAGLTYVLSHSTALLTKHYAYIIKHNGREDDNNLILSINLIGLVVRLLILAIAFLVSIYVVTGKPPSGVLAAMGVGGVALAFAAQDLIKNILSGITLMVDRPFAIGQHVNVFEYEGSIENIGFRSTQLRTFEGQLVTIPNAQISDAAIKNASERQFMRFKGFINLTFDHTAEQVEEAVAIIKNILATYQDELDHESLVAFSEIGSYSLNILMIYYFKGNRYDLYYQFCEKVNLAILKEFKKAKIIMAFPRSEVVVLKNDNI